MVDVISITDAAFKALSNEGSCKTSENSSFISKTIRTDDGEDAIFSDVEPPESVKSQSSTASDVLVRSTYVEQDNDIRPDLSIVGKISSRVTINSPLNSSKDSNHSNNSSFQRERAKKVKVSAKNLRQIDPPNLNIENICDILNKSDNSINKKRFKKGRHQTSESASLIIHTEKSSNVPAKSVSEAINSPFMIEKHLTVDDILHQSSSMSEQSSNEHVSILDVNRRPLDNSDTDIFMLHGSSPDLHLGISDEKNHQPAGLENTGSSADKCAESEILTIQEQIVTVQATEKDSDTSSITSHEPKKNSAAISSKERFKCSLLYQGSLQEVTSSNVNAKNELEIKQFATSNKQKSVRQKFIKRQQQNIPVKKVVPARIVSTVPKQDIPSSDRVQTSSDPVTAAAVAASAAVAATQPFLRAQQDIEMKMAQILQQLAVLQGNEDAPMKKKEALSTHASQDSGIVSAPPSALHTKTDVEEIVVHASGDKHKMYELQRHIDTLNENRLNYLEKMQEHQAAVQAKLISITHDPVAPPRSPTSQYLLQSPKHRSPTVPEKSWNHSSKTPPRGSIKKSGLLTPAPRKAIPVPVAYDTSHLSDDLDIPKSPEYTKSRVLCQGLLETILAQTPPRQSMQHTSPSFLRSEKNRPDLNKARSPASKAATQAVTDAQDLLGEIKCLRSEMQTALKDAANVKANVQTLAEDFGADVLNDNIPIFSEVAPPLLRHAPIDIYMKKQVESEPSSPYPSLKAPSKGDVPVVAKFSDAKEALHTILTMRKNLENNLQTIAQGKHQDDIYNIITQISKGSQTAERIRIQNMVDEYITSMNADLKSEILDEMQRIEEQRLQDKTAARGRDFNTKFKVKPGIKGKMAEARINSGLTRSSAAIPISIKHSTQPAAKKKPIKVKGAIKSLYQTEDYMNQIYGKGKHSNTRATQKEPYLRYKTVPSPKATRPPAKNIEKGPKRQGEPKQFYFNPSAHQNLIQAGDAPATSMMGQLIPMAIPLGKPQQKGSFPPSLITPAITPLEGTPAGTTAATRPAGILNPKTSTPMTPTADKGNLASLKSPKKALEKKVLSPVNINSQHQIEVVSITSDKSNISDVDIIHQVDAKSNTNANANPENEDEDQAGEEPIALPGTAAPPSTYHGPSFPPQQPEPVQHYIGEAAERRTTFDLLQNKAIDWIEQELMAQMLTGMANKFADQKDEKPSGWNTQNAQLTETETQSMKRDNVIGAIGHGGMQLFVDAGVEVDDKLVNNLIHEVILEQIRSTVGIHDHGDGMGLTSTTPRTRPQHVASERNSKSPEREFSQIKDNIRTPEVTPEGSPRAKSHDEIFQAPKTPELSEADHVPEPRLVVETEEETEYINQSIQIDTMQSGQVKPSSPELISRHSVVTPISSPPGTPTDRDALTPQISEAEMPPETVQNQQQPAAPPNVQSPYVQPTLPSTVQPPYAHFPMFPYPVMPSTSIPTPDAKEKGVDIAVGTSPPPSEHLPSEPEISEHSLEETDNKPHSLPEPAPAYEKPDLKSQSDSDRLGSSTTSSISSIDSSSLSQTIDQCISEGQLLVSIQSEGEQRDFPYPQVLGVLGKGRIGGHADDTLHDTEDLDTDKILDVNESEGEVRLPKEAASNALLALLKQIKKEPIRKIEQQLQEHLTEATATNKLSRSEKQEQSVGEVITKPYNTVMVTPADSKPDHIDITKANTEVKTDNIGGQSASKSALSRGRGMMSGPMKSTEVDPRSRRSPGPALRPKVIRISSLDGASEPDEEKAAPAPSAAGSTGFRQVLDSQDTMFGTGGSDADFRTMTPDQMNVQALLMSQDYLSKTASDLGSTSDQGQLGYTGDRTYMSTQEYGGDTFNSTALSGYTAGADLQKTSDLGRTRTIDLHPTTTYDMDNGTEMGLTEMLAPTGSELGFSTNYPDSLEGTLDDKYLLETSSELPNNQGQGRQKLSVTIPSMEQTESEVSDNDVSEFSIGKDYQP